MNAQKAIQLLTPLKEEEFLKYDFTNEVDRCCVLGHLTRLTSEDPSDYSSRNCTPDYDNGEDYPTDPVLVLNKQVGAKGPYSLLQANNISEDVKEGVLKALNKLI